MMKTAPYDNDIKMIHGAIMDMLRDIKADIQTQAPTTEVATKQITKAMMENMTKGSNEQPLMPQVTLEQLAEMYSTFPGATPKLGGQFSTLIKDFVTGYMDIAQKQGLTDDGITGNADK